MQFPSQNINVEFDEKYESSLEPKLSFVTFLDENGATFIKDKKQPISYYENDRDRSLTHIYNVKNNSNEFSNVITNIGVQPGCKRFWKRFKYAKKIYILDKFFGDENYFRLLNEITENAKLIGYNVPRVNIITEQVGLIRSFETPSYIYLARQDNIKKLDFFHDRFVWMDGEIWHFGAAAGGMHAGYQAVSGGWEDKGGCFEKLCKEFF